MKEKCTKRTSKERNESRTAKRDELVSTHELHLNVRTESVRSELRKESRQRKGARRTLKRSLTVSSTPFTSGVKRFNASAR
jgi:hypothetical protein